MSRNNCIKRTDYYAFNYQSLTGEIIKGSEYEIELYKKKLSKYEEHCEKIEKKIEFCISEPKIL